MAHDANRHVTIGDDPDQPGSLLDDRRLPGPELVRLAVTVSRALPETTT